jgi:F-type H+-transporting ATPase subunit delta
MIDRMFAGRASATLVNSLKVMARHGRLGIIRDVARTARQLLLQRAGRVSVELETASALDQGLEQEILSSFTAMLGADPIISARINPDLIAGFVVRVGDRVYDGSVRTQLEHMRQGMLSRAVEAIQRGPERFFTNNTSA